MSILSADFYYVIQSETFSIWNVLQIELHKKISLRKKQIVQQKQYWSTKEDRPVIWAYAPVSPPAACIFCAKFVALPESTSCVSTHHYAYIHICFVSSDNSISLLTTKKASKHFCVQAYGHYSVQHVSRFSGCRPTAAAIWPVLILLWLWSYRAWTHLHCAPLGRRWL